VTPHLLRRLLWVVLALLAAGFGAYAVRQALPLLNPGVVATAPLNPTCDLRQGSCAVQFADGTRVSLSIEPRRIPPLQPLAMEVQVEGTEASAAELDLVGINMNMGYNRPALSPSGAGSFRGTLTIPVCVRNRMDWEARVLLHTDAGLIAAPFRFSTFKSDVGAP